MFQAKTTCPQLTLISKLPETEFDDGDRSFLEQDDRPSRTRKISGAALRTLHEFLRRQDPNQVWGGLTRTTTPEGDVLWICQEHIKELYSTASRSPSGCSSEGLLLTIKTAGWAAGRN